MLEAIELIGGLVMLGLLIRAMVSDDSPEQRSWFYGSFMPWAKDAATREARLSRVRADQLVRGALAERDRLGPPPADRSSTRDPQS